MDSKNSSDSQIGLGLRPRPISAVLGIFFIQLFPNWTACSPITYTNHSRDYSLNYTSLGPISDKNQPFFSYHGKVFALRLVLKQRHKVTRGSSNHTTSIKSFTFIVQFTLLLACVASVPERRERNSGRAKEVFACGPREKWGESKKMEGAGWGRGNKVTLARKPLDFEKPIRPRTGLLIGAAWLF